MKKNIHVVGGSAATLALAAILLVGNAGSALAATTFTRDLTLGASGSDVSALQGFLISKGFSVPSGPTGYFGAQTKAALGAYQAAHGIVPAVGFFGPTTRASVNAADASTPTTPTPSTPTSPLTGKEATIRSYNLVSEDSDGNEGEEDVAVATAEFDVTKGDIRVERMEITVSATNPALGVQPWKYFDRINVESNGKTVASMDTDSRNDWDEVSKGTYRITLSGMQTVIRKNDSAELTITADINDSIDSGDQAQSFDFSIEDDGIRAVDAAGIQQYVGKDSDTVRFGFGAEENGDLTIRTSKEDPESSILVADDDKESTAYDVFAFELNNKDSVDTLVREVTVSVNDLNSGVSASDVIRRATLKLDGKKYTGTISGNDITFKKMKATIDGDDAALGELSVTLMRNATSTPISFAVDAADIEAEGVTSGDDAEVSGTQSSEIHTIAFTGVTVGATSANAVAYSPGNNIESSYGVYTLKFTVTGIEDDAFVSATASTTDEAGIMYVIGGSDFVGTMNATVTSSAKRQGDYYVVREGKTETFTLTIVLNPETAGMYNVRLNGIRFNDEASLTDSTTYTVPTQARFTTDPVYIPS